MYIPNVDEANLVVTKEELRELISKTKAAAADRKNVEARLVAKLKLLADNETKETGVRSSFSLVSVDDVLILTEGDDHVIFLYSSIVRKRSGNGTHLYRESLASGLVSGKGRVFYIALIEVTPPKVASDWVRQTAVTWVEQIVATNPAPPEAAKQVRATSFSPLEKAEQNLTGSIVALVFFTAAFGFPLSIRWFRNRRSRRMSEWKQDQRLKEEARRTGSS